MMDLDSLLPDKIGQKACRLLQAAGFIRATLELCTNATPRAIAWYLGGAKAQRRKTALELIELACDE